MYLKKSLPRDTSRSNPGAVTAKGQFVTLVDTDDILSMPDRGVGDVRVDGNIVLKPNARMVELYLTPSTQDPKYASEGDEDAESFTHTVMGSHPGNSLDAKEFIQGWTGRPAIAFWSGCDNGSGIEMYGTKCAPLKLKTEFSANNEKTGSIMTFASVQKTRFVPASYFGELSLAENFEAADFDLELLEASGNVQQLPASTAANAVTVANNDFAHGSIISLIGGGGSTPATIATAAGIVLKEGTTWTALKDAVINFRVFDDGSSLVLHEVSRA